MLRPIYLIISLMLFLSIQSFAQNFRGFNYQGVLRDPGNGFAPMENELVTLYFEIIENSQNADPVYREKAMTSTNVIGVVNWTLGNGEIEIGNFDSIDWSTMPKWLRVVIEIDEEEVLIGTNPLVGVPYALYAESSGTSLEAGDGIDIEANQIINTGDLNEGQDIHEGDVAGGDLLGTFPNPSIGTNVIATENIADGAIMPEDLNQMGAENGQVLKWNNAIGAWEPMEDTQGDIEGVIADGEVTGALNQLVIESDVIESDNIQDGTIRPEDLSTSGAAPGSVLKLIGANWVYAPDETGIQDGASAGGDLLGTYPNPSIGTNVVATENIADGAIMPEDLNQMGAENGQVLKWNNSIGSWEAQNDNAGSGGDNWGDQTVETDETSIEGTGVIGDPIKLGRNGANNGEILKWDGINEEWVPEPDMIVTYSGGTGILIDPNNNQINNTGDLNPNDDLLENDIAGGDVVGTFDDLQIKQGVVGEDELADNAVTTDKIQNGAIQPADLSTQGASNGDVLKFDNGNWVFAEDDIGDAAPNYTEGPGIDITGTEISNTGDLDGTDDLLKIDNAGGDISGTFDDLQIETDAVTTTEIADNTIQADDIEDEAVNSDKIKDGSIEIQDLGLQGANEGDVLKFDGSAWNFSPDESGSGSDDWGTQVVIHDESLEGEGTNENPLGIARAGVNEGQVLKFISGDWVPASDNGEIYDPGIGIEFDGSSINALNEEEIWNAGLIKGKQIGGMGPSDGDVFYYNGTEWNYGQMDGEVKGTYDGLVVDKIKGKKIGGMGPADGDVFYYDADSGDEGEWKYGTLQGEVTGTYDALVVDKIKGKKIGGMGPADGDVFYYDAGSGDEGEWRYGTLQGEVGGTYDQLELQIPIDKSDNLSSSMIRMENDSGVGLEGVTTNENEEIFPANIANSGDPNDVSDDYGIGILGVGAPGGPNDGIGVWGKAMDNENGFGYGGIFQGRFVGLAAFTYPQSGGNCELSGNAGIRAYGNDCTNSAIQGFANGARFGGYFVGLEHDFYMDDMGNPLLTAGIYASDNNGADYAGFFDGDIRTNDDLFVDDDLFVAGTINNFGFTNSSFGFTGGLKAFKIDHPLDPDNKFLFHSCVESPDMKNIYDGLVTTNEEGFASVELPEYFEALNEDFRYQLTVIGQFAQAIIAEKVNNNRFVIQTDKPNVEVSWQVTGIRHDPFAEKNRITVEVEKNEEERGKYLHSEAYNLPKTENIYYQKEREKLLNSEGIRK